MTAPFIAACLWVLAATATAMLPMRWQYVPGVALLAAAVGLLIWIGLVHGPLAAGVAALAVLSLFRRPLLYFAKKAFAR